MSIPAQLAALAGHWEGTNKLWLDPTAPVRESDSILIISLAAGGKFARFDYCWEYEGAVQEGLLVVGSAGQASPAQAVWIDAWHMQDLFMILEGSLESNGGFSVNGAYAAPPGPDWGWRIALEPQDAHTFRFTMYNITPEGLEFLAVETIYRRSS